MSKSTIPIFVHECPDKPLSPYGLTIWSCCLEVTTPKKINNSFRYYKFYSISQLIKGEGYYVTPDIPKKFFGVGQGVITPPDYLQKYGSEVGDYVEDYICFGGPIADHLHDQGLLPTGIIDLGKQRRLLPIHSLFSDPSPIAQLEASVKLQELLIDLHRENQSKSIQSVSKIELLITELKKDLRKWWSVAEMAEFCNLSPSRFRVVFQREMKVSPKNYLDRLKLNSAAQYLLSSTDSLAAIAALYNYRDQFHFSRRFKQVHGISPQNYRSSAKGHVSQHNLT